MSGQLLQRILAGRTDLVWEWLANGLSASAADADGTSLLQWCSYYGDVTAIRLLVERGASLDGLGENYGLEGAAFHGHWRLCEYLVEQGADVNHASPETGETPLHACLSTSHRTGHDLVLQVLLGRGARTDCHTKPGVETGSFMRDCRTKGETPLHRAAAFGSTTTIQQLLSAGASREARDAAGDTPLCWASWYLRPDSVLRLLCYGPFRVGLNRRSMAENVLGQPL